MNLGIKLLFLSLLSTLTFANISPENVLLSDVCKNGYHNTYKNLPSPKAFSYSRDATGRDLCNWYYGTTLEKVKVNALKACTDSEMKSPCHLIAVNDKFIAKKGQFPFISPVDNTPLSPEQLKALKAKAKAHLKGDCYPLFKKYLGHKGYKSFSYAVATDGTFSCGQGYNYPTQKQATKSSLKFCAKSQTKIPCKVYALGNKVLLSLKDYGIDAEEIGQDDLPTTKRKKLLHMAETFIDSAPCQSSLRLYLYPHKQQAFYLAVDKDGKQACGWEYAKFSIQEAKKGAKKACEKAKNKNGMTSTCKPLFVNFNIINEEKDFGIKRGESDYLNAIHRGNLIKVKEYVAAGNDVNTISKKDGMSPLFLAAAQGDETFFHKLIKKGANIKHKANDGSSLLFAACLGRNPNIVRYLLDKGFDINAKGTEGNTALHAAFMVMDTYLAKILMQEGANPSIKNDKNKTAYDMAKGLGINLDEYKTLDPNKKD